MFDHLITPCQLKELPSHPFRVLNVMRLLLVSAHDRVRGVGVVVLGVVVLSRGPFLAPCPVREAARKNGERELGPSSDDHELDVGVLPVLGGDGARTLDDRVRKLSVADESLDTGLPGPTEDGDGDGRGEHEESVEGEHQGAEEEDLAGEAVDGTKVERVEEEDERADCCSTGSDSQCPSGVGQVIGVDLEAHTGRSRRSCLVAYVDITLAERVATCRQGEGTEDGGNEVDDGVFAERHAGVLSVVGGGKVSG